MKIETLKKLIEIEFKQSETMYDFKEKVMALVDVFEFDKEQLTLTDNEEIPYHQLCGCNPKNGGCGVCGCTIGNKMVPNYYKTQIYFNSDLDL